MIRPTALPAGAVALAAAWLLLPAAPAAQDFVSKAPTAADWAALATLPDFNGVWERGAAPAAPRGGGAPAAPRSGGAPPAAPGAARGGGARGGGRAGGPSFTPAYEAMRAAAAKTPAPEDGATANCLPPGMPGIMGQPYPMEFLLTPGKVTLVIEAYTQVRHIYTDGRPLPADHTPG